MAGSTGEILVTIKRGTTQPIDIKLIKTICYLLGVAGSTGEILVTIKREATQPIEIKLIQNNMLSTPSSVSSKTNNT